MTLVDSGDGNTVAAYDAAGHTLVLVTTNYRVAQIISYDLSSFRGIADGLATGWRTATNGDYHYQQFSALVSKGKFSMHFDANTVQTIVVGGVTV